MKIFLDTNCDDFFLVMFNEEGCIIYRKLIENLKEKVANIPLFFKEMLFLTKTKVSEIKEFYVTKGPGSFTGSRMGLLFLRTISQLKEIPLFTIENIKLMIVTNQIINDNVLIKIAKEKFLSFRVKNSHVIGLEIVKRSKNYNKINYDYFAKNFGYFSSFFKEEENLLDISISYYIKPQIG